MYEKLYYHNWQLQHGLRYCYGGLWLKKSGGVWWRLLSLVFHYWMRDAHHWSEAPVSEMTFTVSSGTLNSTIHTYIVTHIHSQSSIHSMLPCEKIDAFCNDAFVLRCRKRTRSRRQRCRLVFTSTKAQGKRQVFYQHLIHEVKHFRYQQIFLPDMTM